MSHGRINYHVLAGPNEDKFTTSTDSAVQAFIRNNIQFIGTYSPYFDDKLSWMPKAYAYIDSYAIYVNGPSVPNLASQPQFIATDVNGNKLFIPWGPIPFSQYAGDISNPAFREWMIEFIKSILFTTTHNYIGLWLDDVNLSARTCDAAGNIVMPLDKTTGAAMTAAAWASYFAEYVTLIRTALPQTTKILHNSIWTTAASSDVDKQISSCDYINLERGFGDTGLTGGNGQFSLTAFMNFIDHVHSFGTNVNIGEYYIADRDYATAGHLLINNGGDLIGFGDQNFDSSWPSLFNWDLGPALGNRVYSNGLWRRDFIGGTVLLNEPAAASVTVPFNSTMIDFQGNQYSEVTLQPKQGIVLMKLGWK